MSQYWSRLTHSLEPYVPGEQPKNKEYIKLNTNENPYPPSPKVIEAIQQAADSHLRLYPSPTCDDLRECIAQYHDLTEDQVFVGNGSDEVLALAFWAFFNPGEPILFPDITYSFYPVYANLCHIDYHLIPLSEDFSIPLEKFLTDNGGIIFPNPNAPTGKYVELAAIEKLLQKNSHRIVIIDEAYIDFGGESAVQLINKYPNLLVIQTLSKSRSLAGLRVGFALGNSALIEGLNRVKNSFNSYTLDRLALAGALAAFKDEFYFQETRQKVITTRTETVAKLQEMGFTVLPSLTNFIFISHPAASANSLYMQLKEKGILVRYFNQPRIDNFLRVSIGTDEEMKSFLETLTEILNNH